MSTLTREVLLERLKNPDDDLAIIPLLDPEGQADHGAINLRLGAKFILTRRTRYPLISPKNIDEHEIKKFQRRIRLCFGEPFIIHPGQFVLASTFEFVSIPDNLCGFVFTRSRYGRTGLVIATATYVHPCWRGCLTLELANYGDVPLELTCGSQVGQLVLSDANRVQRTRKYKSIPVEPEFSIMCDDPEWKKLQDFCCHKSNVARPELTSKSG